MITSILKKIFGDKANKEQKEYQPIIDKSNEFFIEFNSLTDNELRGKTAGFQKASVLNAATNGGLSGLKRYALRS